MSLQAAHDGLVAEVDAVKDADGEAVHARMRGELQKRYGTDEHRFN
jgi:hypothetical protein